MEQLLEDYNKTSRQDMLSMKQKDYQESKEMCVKH